VRVTICHQSTVGHARADELDVLQQVQVVEQALGNSGARVTVLPCSLDLSEVARVLRAGAPDVVFNLVESLDGRGELIAVVPGLLDSLEIPYTGAPAEALFLTSNKSLARLRMGYLELPIAAGSTEGTAGRYIVKSVWEHASHGLDTGSVVPLDEVENEISVRERQFGGRFFAEAYVDGREFNVALLGGAGDALVLPIAEMVFTGYPADMPKVVDYGAKWDPESFGYQHTKRQFLDRQVESQLYERLEQLAQRCWQGFELEGYARVDFRVDGDNIAIVDVNANPCLSPDAGYAAALERAQVTVDAAIERIVEAALARRPSSRFAK
jgi:D-alanine-D-alanine ligase